MDSGGEDKYRQKRVNHVVSGTPEGTKLAMKRPETKSKGSVGQRAATRFIPTSSSPLEISISVGERRAFSL